MSRRMMSSRFRIYPGGLAARAVCALVLIGSAPLLATDVSADAVNPGWAANLTDFLPAIDACVARAPKESVLPEVTIAWRPSDQVTGVRLMVPHEGGPKYFECFADARGRAVKTFKELPHGTEAREGEGNPRYTPGSDLLANCLTPCKTHFTFVKDKAGKDVGLLSYDDTAAN